MTDQANLEEYFTSNYINLLSEKVGGRSLGCSDEWFADASNLVKDSEPRFVHGEFGERGQIMDGWESRRSFKRRWREDGSADHDWAVLRLGIIGSIVGVDVETTHFRGNAPQQVMLEGCMSKGDPDANAQWVELLPISSVEPHSHNVFKIEVEGNWSHVRLRMYPDGGVARLKVYGDAQINPANFIDGELIDLAYVMNGGRGLQCSDMFFSSPTNLLMPGRGINMGDGWETRRSRSDSHEWNIIKLGLPGTIRKVLLDTAHFKGNYPESFRLLATNTDREDITADDIEWQEVIPNTPLYADREHLFIDEITADKEATYTHVRLNIYPDGGVSRLRVFGLPVWPENS